MTDNQVTTNDVGSDRILDMISTALERGIISKAQVFRSMGAKAGRKQRDLPQFTFRGSGITVGIRTLGPFTIDEIGRTMRDEITAPDVPKVWVNYGTEEKPDMRMEENEADPEYKKALEEYEDKIADSSGRRVLDTIIRSAVVVSEYDYEEIEATREFLIGLNVPKEKVDAMSDHEIYVKHICIKIPDDISELQKFVLGESIPSEELVRKHEDSFRSDVQGQADTQMSSNGVGDQP